MMCVAVLAMAAFASVQAAEVNVKLQNRGADQQMTAAQSVQYTVTNADGEIVAEGDGSEIKLDLAEGEYELTVQQTLEDGKVHYGVQPMTVPADGADFAFDVTPDGLTVAPKAAEVAPVIAKSPVNKCKCKYCDCNATREYCAEHCDCEHCDCGAFVVPFQAVQAPTSYVAGRNWGFLGMAGALVATAIALGVDDGPCCVSPCQCH